AAMEEFFQSTETFIASRSGFTAQRRRDLETAAPGSEEAIRAQESQQMEEIFLKDLRSGITATPPTITLEDRLVLHKADLEIRLFAFGTAHTDTDILVLIPALKVLFVGDLFHPDSLSVTAGNGSIDVPRWLDVLDSVLREKDNIKTIIGGHGHIFTSEWLSAQARYVKDLWTAAANVKDKGMNLAQFSTAHPLQNYSYMSEYFDLSSAMNRGRHQQVIRSFWNVGLVSASEEIHRLFDTQNPEAARERFEQIRTELTQQFYIDEREFNALGYRLLSERKLEAAIAVFKMNTEAFPESWNVWDSLGEAHIYSGSDDEAEVSYRKSLELNPQSPSGLNAIGRFEGYRLDVRMQTEASALFKEGVQTELQGLYFGQKPPGTKPEVFAPGIVSLGGHWEFSITFSPNGKEIYFTRRKEEGGSNTMMVSLLLEGGWTAPEEAAFAEEFPSNEPFITPDGKNLYYGSNRPQPGSEEFSYGIWKTERTNDGWGKAQYHGPGMYVSSDQTGDLYMTDISGAVQGGGLIRYPFKGGEFGAPERLPSAINAPTSVAHGYIAPDGSFLLFDASNRPGGQGGEGDVYVSFRNPDGTWGEGQNLGDEVNSPGTNFVPSLSPNGKYLFFSMYRDIYWASAEVIHRLKPGR
ncbi:MAG: hypothetical protein MUP98_08840, partial [Candidatus Aminicenantes bacterium]|nr:hypothetical protein [Candidatus Aminicenantes bacterium]